MLNLFDHLTEKDNTLIENYINLYGASKENYIGNETWLQYWASNKPKLFHLLGGNLIYKVPYAYEVSEEVLHDEIYDLNRHHEFISLFDLMTSWDNADFINELRNGISSNGISDEYTVIKDLRWAIKCTVNIYILTHGKINDGFKFKGKGKRRTLQISEGMKPMRAIQAILNYMDCFSSDKDLMAAFKDYERRYSMILNTKKINSTMCFSIHPLDYMTASDNASNWNSCMNWTEDGGGCYHAGTVEMMNSNNVICVYLEASTPFIFNKDYGPEDDGVEDYTWNNKRWRQFFYCTKEIIVSGKAYPYQSEDVTKFALNTLRELAKKNWNHTYEFGIEPYRDMIHIYSNSRMLKNKDWIRYGETTKHNIIFDTKGMYNDMLNDSNTVYYCVRNKVKKNTIISYSGKAPCLCCMEEVVTESDWYGGNDYNDRYEHTGDVVCHECVKKCTCELCGDRHRPIRVFHDPFVGDIRICEKCWKERAFICPDCGKPYIFGHAEYPDESYSKENNIYMRHKSDVELTWKRLPPVRHEDDGIHHDDDGNITVSLYNCCPDCRKRLIVSNQVKQCRCDNMWGMNSLVYTFNNAIPADSEFAQKHFTKNLQVVPLE